MLKEKLKMILLVILSSIILYSLYSFKIIHPFLMLIGFIILYLYVDRYMKYLKNYNNYKNNYYNKNDTDTASSPYSFSGKLKTSVLSVPELKFYNQLRLVTDKYNLNLFSKIRLADIIETYSKSDFNKVRSKHIDFIILDKDSSPLLFIELDDSSHEKEKNRKNDISKDYIMNSVGIKVIRYNLQNTYDFTELENRIRSKINFNKGVNNGK